MGVISLYSPTFVPQRWHQFLIYIGYTVFAFIVNTFANRGLPYVNQAALVWSLLGFTVICITVSCHVAVSWMRLVSDILYRFWRAADRIMRAQSLCLESL